MVNKKGSGASAKSLSLMEETNTGGRQ